ncbi:family 16 glycoside hydrolase [Candidatus Poribacteria bacterium]
MQKVSQINAVWGIIILLMLIQTTVAWALYFDFEDDAQLDQWDVQGDWKIEKDDLTGSSVLSGEGVDEITALVGADNWTDYTIEFEASGQTDEISVAFRAQDFDNFLSFMIAPNFNLAEWFQKMGGQFDENIGPKGDNLGINIQEWHRYKLVVQGDEAIMFLDDEEVLSPLELDPLPDTFNKGRVGFRQWSDKAHYDNVLITGPGIPQTPGEPGAAVNPGSKLTITWGAIRL